MNNPAWNIILFEQGAAGHGVVSQTLWPRMMYVRRIPSPQYTHYCIFQTKRIAAPSNSKRGLGMRPSSTNLFIESKARQKSIYEWKSVGTSRLRSERPNVAPRLNHSKNHWNKLRIRSNLLDLKERTDVFKDLVLLLTTKVRLKTWRVTLLPRMATSVNLAWNSRQQLVTEQHPQTQTVILGFVRMPYSMPCSLNSQVPTSQWMSWAQLSSSSWFSSALPLGWSCCS